MRTKEKKCKQCGNKFSPRNSFQKTCSVECAIEFGKKEVVKETKKAWGIEKKQRLEKLKSHGDYENELQPIVNKIARLIDKDQPCISCGKIPKKPQGGHRFSVGSNNSIRFNLHNIGIQCFKCNSELSGNPDGYDEGLVKVYGKDYFEYIKFELKLAYPIVKLTIPELITARAKAMEIVKELEKSDKVYSSPQRIELRMFLNHRIGIYDN